MYYILLLLFIINSASANQQKIKFHKAETDAEIALDKILMKTTQEWKDLFIKNNNTMHNFLLLRHDSVSKKEQMRTYDNFFTINYIHTMSLVGDTIMQHCKNQKSNECQDRYNR
jgi:hypothetical protein